MGKMGRYGKVVGEELHKPPTPHRNEFRWNPMEEYMGKEINLWEFRLETDIQIKIDEFGKLSDKIDRVKSELETVSTPKMQTV
jgi:hypothetical protein